MNSFAKIKPITQFIGQNIIYFNCVDSTNTTALEWIKQNNCPNGSIFVTDYQTKGRGQHLNEWHGESQKNLMFSIVINHQQHPVNPFLLNKVTALSILQTIKNSIKSPELLKIKWPNDLYFDKKKIAGILIENNFLGNKINYSVVGIGININQSFKNTSQNNATSIIDITNCECHRYNFFKELIENFEKILIQKNIEYIQNEFCKNLLGFNTVELFKINHNDYLGTIKNCDEFGRLSVLINDDMKHFNHGEIKQII